MIWNCALMLPSTTPMSDVSRFISRPMGVISKNLNVAWLTRTITCSNSVLPA